MINVLEMIESLELEIKDLKNNKTAKQTLIDKYERELVPLKQEVQDITDTLESLEMAYESLMDVTKAPKTNVTTSHKEIGEEYVAPVQTETKFTESGILIGSEKLNGRAPKAVVKKDAHGNVLSMYKSISEAARDNKFDPSSLRNMILKVSPEKQIRLRGMYFVYAQ